MVKVSSRDPEGLHNLIFHFCVPRVCLPVFCTSLVDVVNNDINAQTPGAIHEGGELGSALSVALRAVMDSLDLIAIYAAKLKLDSLRLLGTNSSTLILLNLVLYSLSYISTDLGSRLGMDTNPCRQIVT